MSVEFRIPRSFIPKTGTDDPQLWGRVDGLIDILSNRANPDCKPTMSKFLGTLTQVHELNYESMGPQEVAKLPLEEGYLLAKFRVFMKDRVRRSSSFGHSSEDQVLTALLSMAVAKQAAPSLPDVSQRQESPPPADSVEHLVGKAAQRSTPVRPVNSRQEKAAPVATSFKIPRHLFEMSGGCERELKVKPTADFAGELLSWRERILRDGGGGSEYNYWNIFVAGLSRQSGNKAGAETIFVPVTNVQHSALLKFTEEINEKLGMCYSLENVELGKCYSLLQVVCALVHEETVQRFSTEFPGETPNKEDNADSLDESHLRKTQRRRPSGQRTGSKNSTVPEQGR